MTGIMRAARVLLVSGSLLVLAACGTHSIDIAEPRVAIPAEWQVADPAPISADISQYWTLLDDPLLTRFVQQAILDNRDLAQSAARLEQARASLVQARAGYLPSISANGGLARDVGDLSRDGVQLSLGADAAWEADLFGQISGNVAAAEGDLLAQGYTLADLQRLIVGQVAIATINARSLAEQLAIARSTLAYQDDNLQIARWRNQAGLVSSLDVEQARTQRAQTAATIPLLESNLVATANSISTLIGEPPGRVLDAIVASEPEPVPSPPLLAGFEAPAEVLRRRPDVRAAEFNLVSSTARIGVARAQLLPLVRLTGNIGTGPDTAGNLFDLVTGGLFAGVSQLIFDGGRTAAQVDIAEAGADASLAAWEQSILNALEDVETAAVDQRTASERVVITEEALDAASNSALLARSQYQAGLTDFRTLLTAENQLLSARNQLVTAQADRASAFVRLTQALGGGWSISDYDLPPVAAAEPLAEIDRTAE
ncbi:efflux transporter outer membrane subunit [Aurantiacibacter poecillastricola]|uniref:efflux transporter outer membrane subunit n=1 Tax=Aurantiacibacter poecillastricola TaxID=3064385 RepID=UPI00273E8530|nr:efflux transporter outer membrane subunit [Aurantiacibacter sp. 219JJ12-13]MDP5261396.1 efflux transporter outer membrane subunit [Aurantiacibacter sp. 219JJ12-13]